VEKNIIAMLMPFGYHRKLLELLKDRNEA
jgi:hypothetical protein